MQKKITLILLFLTTTYLGFAQDLLMQDGTFSQCSGTFYDSGGASGNYDNQDYVITICPENPGQLVQLNFTEFSIQLGHDFITIYNGDSTAAPAFGTFSGINSPGIVTATEDNGSGCLTIEFIQDGDGATTGWAADISCLTPCQVITSQIDTASPAPNADGYIRVCPDEEITLTGSGNFEYDGTGATYEWDLGDGNTIAGQTATFSYSTPGVYIVNLNITDANTSINPEGCSNTNLINQVIQVATEPDFTGTEAAEDTICFGESTTIEGVVTETPFINDCTPPVSGTTFLPDGNGAVYSTCITVDCFDSNQTLTDPNQLLQVCVNIEHSYSGDLDIKIISPNGQEADLFTQAGSGTYFGAANDDGSNNPGVGADYCFSMSGSVLLQNAPTITAGSPPNASWEPGVYLPVESFNALVGSPLNGEWCIEVVDNLTIDNGYIFSWGMEFDPNIQPPELSFTPAIISEDWDTDPSITNTTGNTITVQPATAGQHCYTYRAIDDFGCEYTEEVCITVLPEIITEQPDDLYVCDTGAPPYIFDLTQNTPIVLNSAPNASELVVTYHENLLDAENDTNPISNPGSYSGTDGQVIYIRVEYQTSDCYEILSFTLNVSGQPVINPVPDLVVCDDPSNDGIAEFDLSSQDAGILGAQDPADFVVSYYLSYADADAGTNALSSPYQNVSNPEPIYVRVENADDSSCYIASPTPVFELIVDYMPVATAPIDLELCDDVSGDGIETFDLLQQNATILSGQDPAIYQVSYYQSLVDAETGANAIATPGAYNNSGSPETIYVRVIDPAYPDCYGITNFDLIVNPLPDAIVPTPLAVCDDDADGIADFMLSDKTTEILNGQADVVVSYHASLADADTGASPLAEPYQNTTNPETVYVRLENTITGCYSTTTLDLIVNPLPVPVSPTPLQVCDDDNDGYSAFDLTLKDAEILGGQTGLTVSYYETQVDADNGNNALTSPYNNIVANTQTIYARVEDDVTGCHETVELVLVVNPLPTVFNVSPYELCDYNATGDEQETFDLSTKDAEVLGGQTSIVVSYHESQSDAELGVNPITAPIQNTTNPQTIYYALTNTNTNCSTTGSFELVVNPLPVYVAPTPLEVCDDNVPDGIVEMDLTLKNGEISGNNPDYSISYYASQSDADAGSNPLPTPYVGTDGEMVYVRIQDINTGCYDTTTMDLVVEQAPVANIPTPLEYCDPDSDGFGVFDLTLRDNEITGGAAGMIVSYHETLVDAENDVNPLLSPYNNIMANTQTVYARVESATIATDCATIVPLELIVNPTPQLGPNPPSPLEVCDDASGDGIAQFDLLSKEAEILQNLADPAQYTVSFYETEANAEGATNAITTPGAYINTVPQSQTIWVRVDDNTTGCYKLTTLELIVNSLPVLTQPTPLSLCDYDNPGDEQEYFTLEDASDEILSGQTGISLTFYTTQVDAEQATNPISSPYQNLSNPQTVYVRGEDDVTGCYSVVTLDLRVNPLPSPEPNPTPLQECDPDNDGYTSFNLEDRTVEIINGEADIAITYHETQSDAEQGVNALVSPYENVSAWTQEVFARAENTITGCYRVVSLELEVLESPVLPTTIEDYVICDSDGDGYAQFDLTTMDSVLYGSQNPADYTLTYHVSVTDAESGLNPIVNVWSYTNQSNPQTLYVRLESNTNGCVDIGEFDLRVELPPTAVQPTPLELCDDEVADEQTVFDLTVKDDEITGGNASWSVSYYETQADADAGINAVDAEAYTNTSVNGAPANPQTLYAVVTDTDTGCTDQVTLTIRVLPNPTPGLDPDDLELCDDVTPGDGIEAFDLTVNETYIINGEAGVTATYYETELDAEAGTNAIADPTAYQNMTGDFEPQTIYVRVTNDLTGCYTLVDFTITVHPLPDVVAVTDYIACEVNTDGVYGFDLTVKDAEVLGDQLPTDYTVSYHASQADADAGINALVSPYNNTSNPQTIYVTITNNTTGCSVSTQTFNLEVHEGALANSDQEPIVYVECDDNMEFDGDPTNDSVQFDLSTQDAEVLDGQDPSNYIVSYYESLSDAEQGVNPLPTLYENITNPQVIYARVDNDTPDGTGADSSICYAITELTLEVAPLPAFMLDDEYTLCVDTNGSEVLAPLVLDTGLSEVDYTFQWELDGVAIPGATGSSYAPTQGGVYGVTVTDVLSFCASSLSTTVEESAPPVVSAEVVTQAFSENHVIEVVATGLGVYEYSLDDGPWQSESVFEDVSYGEHVVTVRDIEGCGESSVLVTVMDYPKYFTPNGDGYHDTWNIVGFSNQPSAKIYIFDRYGKLLKQISPSGNGWDGTYNGAPMPTNDYWFVVEYVEDGKNKEFKAHFTLKR